MNATDLADHFGSLDIYLFDQLLKGRFEGRSRLLDAGCGRGRNLRYFLRNGFSVHAIDQEASAVDQVRAMAAELAPGLSGSNFQVAPLEAIPFASGQFDAVICNAVLHFARDPQHFSAMWSELGRVLGKGGLLFVRLASSIGIEDQLQDLGQGRYRLPDGSERFLVDEPGIARMVQSFGGELLDPLKSTVVSGRRSMTTLCLCKA